MNFNKNLAFVLSAIMLLFSVGCNSKTTSEITTSKSTDELKTSELSGKYVEKDMSGFPASKDEYYIGMNVDDSGKLNYYTVNYIESEPICYSVDGDDVKSNTVDWIKSIGEDKSIYIVEAFVGDDGNNYSLIADIENQGTDDEQYLYKLYRCNATASSESTDSSAFDIEDISPTGWDNKINSGNGVMSYPMFSNVGVCENGSIVCFDVFSNALSVFSKSGQLTDLENSSYASTYDISNNLIYYTDPGTNDIYVYDTEKMQNVDNYKTNFSLADSFISVKSDKTIYLLNKLGILKLASDGSIWECVAKGDDYHIGSPTYEMKNFMAIDGDPDCFYINYYSDSSSTGFCLSKIYFDNEVSNIKPENTLTIYSLNENRTIEEAVVKFKALHPEIEIDSVIANDTDTSATVSDQIRALNTEILSGDGADIFVLDGLPMDSYIEKDVLLDMSDILLPMVKDGTLSKNICENYVNDGKIYGMPTQFCIPIYIADEESLKKMDTLDNVAKLAKSSTDKKLFVKTNKESFFKSLLLSYYNSLLQKDGNIDKEKYKAFLENVKTIYDNADDRGMAKYDDPNINTPVFDSIFVGGGSCLYGNGVKSVLQVVIELGSMASVINETKVLDAKVQSINNQFIPYGIVGINSTTKNKDLSKEFVKLLFSDDIQKVNLYEGLPVSTGAFDERMKTVQFEGMSLMFDDLDGKSVDENVVWPKEEEFDDFKEIISKLDTPINDDTLMINMIFDESQGFLDGTKSSEEATNDVYNKLSMYLSE